ncbi:MAG: alcohol dehydrogenase, partial [Alphaproteobacteria bacterium]
MRKILVRFLMLSIILSNLLPSAYSQLYEWRGPDRTGIYNEKNLLKSWPAEGPRQIWSIDNIGNGFVSPVF